MRAISPAAAAADIASGISQTFAAALRALCPEANADEAAEQLFQLLAGPMEAFAKHPNWPTGLSAHGVPLELSIAIPPHGPPSLRYAVDVTDHTKGLAGNWNRYEQAMAATCGHEEDQSTHWALLARHLDGAAPLFRTRMAHGRVYEADGHSYGNVYFHTRWLTLANLLRRFPEELARLERAYSAHGRRAPGVIDWMAYDFPAGHGADGASLYTWLLFSEGPRTIADFGGDNPDLGPGIAIARALAAPEWDAPPDRSVCLQVAPAAPDHDRMKVMFGCKAWGWDTPAGFANLLAYAFTHFGVDLDPVRRLLDVVTAHHQRVRPTLFSIGPDSQPPRVAFYFGVEVSEVMCTGPRACGRGSTSDLSTPPRAAGGAVNGLERAAREMLTGGMDYVLRARKPSGEWQDFCLDEPDGVWFEHPIVGPSDEWVTAYVLSVVGGDVRIAQDIGPGLRWLEARYREGGGWGWNADTRPDGDTTAMAVLALERSGLHQSRWFDALRRYRLGSGGYRAYPEWDLDVETEDGAMEVTGVALEALLCGGRASADWLKAIAAVVNNQREDGGWNASWWCDDLFATRRIVGGLRATWACDGLTGEMAARRDDTMRRARASVHARPVASDAFALGLWLASWLMADGDLRHPSVRRVIERLRTQQANDGRWYGSPIRRIGRGKLKRPWARSDSGKLYVDSACVVTTVTVVDGLALYAQRHAAEVEAVALEPGAASGGRQPA